jgi:putative membrane protein
MTDESRKAPRKPEAFDFEERKLVAPKAAARQPGAFETGNIVLTAEADDPFLGEPAVEDMVAAPRKRRLPLMSIFAGALGILMSAALALWTDALIRDLFSRADWLGYTAIAVTAIAVLALIGMALREVIGIRRLSSVQALKHEAEIASLDRRPAHARAVVAKLVSLSSAMPETAQGRAALAATADDIIDSEGLLRLAEIELLQPADRVARMLTLSACKRVSVVTAVSPRALVDLGYVLFEASKLVRAIAETYGTRPGRIGMLRLFGDVIAHLAVTGSIAVGDGIVQQLLGHGIASKISARFGEGVINGLMTARIGIAAMDLLRPLPFKAVKRPGVGDFLADLTGAASENRRKDA